MDLHNLDLMSDFLSSAPAMLGGPIFGGGGKPARGPAGTNVGMSVTVPMRQASNAQPPPPPPPPAHATDESDYPGDLTASEAVKAVTQLLEASSRKLQKVTEEQQGSAAGASVGGASRVKDRAVDSMNVRLDRTGNQTSQSMSHGEQSTHPPLPPLPAAAAQAILQARARDQIPPEDQEDSDIDAISVEGDVEAFDEDEDEAYYSDEEYDDDEEYDEEDGVTYLTDGEEDSDYSHAPSDEAGSSCYDSQDGEDDDENYPVAEVMPFHAPVKRKHHSHPATESAPRQPGEPSTPPRPHYSTIPYLPGSRRNPVTGKQMREILDRLSPAARHNYQQALIREHQLEMEHEQRLSLPPTQQQIPPTVPPPQSLQQPSVLDDPAVMASRFLLPFLSRALTLPHRIKRSTNCFLGSRRSSGRSNNMPSAPPARRWRPKV